MVYFQSYFDESGTIENTKYLSFCGLLGTNEDWTVCYRKWSRALHDLGLKDFKANRAFRYMEPLSNKCPAIGAEKRIEALAPLLSTILETMPLCASVILFCDDFHALSQKEKKILGEDPTYIVILNAMTIISLSLDKITTEKERCVSIVCDDHHKYAPQFLAAYRRARQVKDDFRKIFGSIGFADDKLFDQLQMADFVASLVRQEAAHRHEAKPYELRGLYEHFFDSSHGPLGKSTYMDTALFKELVVAQKTKPPKNRSSRTIDK